jgi:hypothetical protein
MRQVKVKWLKDAKPEGLKDVLVMCIGQMNAKNGTATDEIIEKRAKVHGQQMGITDSTQKNGMYFALKNKLQ